MPTRNVDLTEHFDEFIDAGVSSGRYRDASEVVREGLRMLEQRESENHAKLEWLRQAAKEGFDEIDRGEGIAFDFMEELDAHVDRLGEEASSEVLVRRQRG